MKEDDGLKYTYKYKSTEQNTIVQYQSQEYTLCLLSTKLLGEGNWHGRVNECTI